MRRINRRAKPIKEKQFRANQQIKSEKLLLIGPEGEQYGLVPLAKALTLAEEAELDLVEVNPKVNPPIAKIMDYGQFKYEKDKQAQKQKVKQKKSDTKILRLSVRIGSHDSAVRLEQAKKFLAKGNKLKIELRLKGREKQHPLVAREVLAKFAHQLQADENWLIEVAEPLTKQGGQFTILLINKGKK